MDPSRTERNLILARRQQCACLIQELGSRLQTTQVVINAGIYYMHHFYEVFSPETIKPILVAIAAFYCACKTEDFSRKLAFLIKATYDILKRPVPDEASDTFKRLVQNIHALEATLLMVIGFQTLEVKQPHVLLVNAIRANKFPKEISHSSYYVCTNILHLTTLILRHSAEAIAAASLYIAAKWNGSDIQSSNGEWYHIFSPTLTFDEIAKITEEFTLTFQACDIKIKEQLRLTLRSRKMQRDQKIELAAPRGQQDALKKPVIDSTQPQKPDDWKSERRPTFNTNPGAPQSSSHHHQPTGHHQRPPHGGVSSQGGQNYPYHRAAAPSYHPHGASTGPGGGGGGEHFNRSHVSRPPPGAMAEPDPKRPRFDRSFAQAGRHSPAAAHPTSAHHSDGLNRSHRYDNSSHFNAGDSMPRHGVPTGPPASRSHDYRGPQTSGSGYGSVQNKPLGREEARCPNRSSVSNNTSRVPAPPPPPQQKQPGTHVQNPSRSMNVKHDLNPYF